MLACQRGGCAVDEVKLAECMSRMEGATALGLHGACTLYVPDWMPHLESYGIFGSALGDMSDGEAADSATAETAASDAQATQASSGTTRGQLKHDKVEFDIGAGVQTGRLWPVKLELATASAGQSIEPAKASIGCTLQATPSRPGSPSKRRRTDKDCCPCSGQCGSKTCTARRNQNFRRGLEEPCRNPPQHGRSYCLRCECEVHDCAKPRYRGRWCKPHTPQFRDDGDYKHYSNPYLAKAAFPEEWPPQLRLVAKFNYILPLMVPTDFTLLLEWIPEHMSYSFAVALFLAQSLKWPPAVRVFYDIVRRLVEPATAGETSGSTGSGDAAMARAMAMAYRSAVLALNGASFKEMFDRMNTGLMHAQTGLVVQGTEFGVVSKQSTPRLGEAVLVLLGPAQTRYYVAGPESEAMDCAAEVVSKLLATSREAALAWPTGHEFGGIHDFCEGLLALAKKFRLVRCQGFGFKGGKDEGTLYKVKSFTRVALAMLQTLNPECFREMTYGQLVKYCPDQRELTAALDGMRVDSVQRLLHVNPLLISCWACLFGGIRDSDEEPGATTKQLLAADSSRAWRIVEDDWQKQMAKPIAESRFPIGPRGLAAALTESSAPPVRVKARPAAAHLKA